MRKVLLLSLGLMAAAALVGGLMRKQPVDTRALPAERVFETGDLRLIVNSVVWMRQPQELETAGPGASSAKPEVSANRRYRLDLDVTVQNLGDQARRLEPREFRLQVPDGSSWPATEGRPITVKLRPRQSLDTVLSFDVPTTGSESQVVWARGGHEVRVPVGAMAFDRQPDDPASYLHGRDGHGRDKVTSPAVPIRVERTDRGA